MVLGLPDVRGRAFSAVIFGCLANSAWAVDAIQTGPVEVDPPTLHSLGFSIPIVSGDDNYNANVTVEYRAVGESIWRQALPLLRVRPETISTETPPSTYGFAAVTEQFAGSVMNLEPGTTYEVRLGIVDVDGGSTVESLNVATRAAPATEPANPVPISVATAAQLSSALASAAPGHVIELGAGVYTGSFGISRNGTETNPIIVRGVAADQVTIDASGQTYGFSITGDNVYLQDVSITGSFWGARATGAEGIVIQRTHIFDVQRGIDAVGSANRNYYICDNVLEGRHTWPDISSNTWDNEGIVITGQGHSVCHNRLSGFGDALSLSQNSSIRNIAIDFFGNDVLWSGDDGFELDYGYRNIRAYSNRVSNAGMGVSLQPLWGGPAYIFRNVLINLANSPYKLNNEPSGFYILNNTSIKTNGAGNYAGDAWPQLGYQLSGHWSFAANFQFKNNLLLGATGPARVTTDLILADIDFNAWSPDGQFVFYDTYTNLADVKSTSPYEANGLILTAPVFANSISVPSSYTTQMVPPDVALSAASNAVDAGTALPNITDGFAGSQPDLGAIELGTATPVYGPRQSPGLAPRPPQNLTVE